MDGPAGRNDRRRAGQGGLRSRVPTGPERAAVARELFGKIARRYDVANRVMSGGLDVLWRRRAARELAPKPGERILDLCTGTGDLARTLARASGGSAEIHGADFSLPMLEVSQRKHREAGEAARLVTADALRLPYRADSFDAVIASFGVRSFSDLELGIREMIRVVRPGGRVAIMEFSLPRPGLLRHVYLLYLRHLLPRLGDLVAASPGTYSYLPETIMDFPDQDRLCGIMESAGLRDVRYENLTFGVVALHLGFRD